MSVTGLTRCASNPASVAILIPQVPRQQFVDGGLTVVLRSPYARVLYETDSQRALVQTKPIVRKPSQEFVGRLDLLR